MFDNWLAEFNGIIGRWEQMLAEFKTSDSHEFAKFSVALRELMLLSYQCDSSFVTFNVKETGNRRLIN